MHARCLKEINVFLGLPAINPHAEGDGRDHIEHDSKKKH